VLRAAARINEKARKEAGKTTETTVQAAKLPKKLLKQVDQRGNPENRPQEKFRKQQQREGGKYKELFQRGGRRPSLDTWKHDYVAGTENRISGHGAVNEVVRSAVVGWRIRGAGVKFGFLCAGNGH